MRVDLSGMSFCQGFLGEIGEREVERAFHVDAFVAVLAAGVEDDGFRFGGHAQEVAFGDAVFFPDRGEFPRQVGEFRVADCRVGDIAGVE